MTYTNLMFNYQKIIEETRMKGKREREIAHKDKEKKHGIVYLRFEKCLPKIVLPQLFGSASKNRD